jgi:hypothetical protein
MEASRWLLAHPSTSDEAARLAVTAARRGVWVPLGALAAGLAFSIALAANGSDGSGIGAPLMLVAVGAFAYLQASALVYREAYHRLQSEGK